MSAGSCSRRIRLMTVVRSLPVRSPICSAVRFSSADMRAKAAPVSIGLRSSRWMFSISVIRSRRLSGISRPPTGTVATWASLAARSLRSPATSWYWPLTRRTTRGWIIPLARIDWANSSNRLSWKTRRGWNGFGWMASTGMLSADSCGSHGSGDGSGPGGWMWVRVGRSAPIPLPSALRGCSGLLMIEDLFGEFDVAFGPLRSGVIGQDGFAETGRFGQAYAAGDDGPEDLVLEELA